jgi:proline dehydrogenase
MDMLNTLVSHTLPFMPKSLVWHFSKTYIAGETAADAIRVSQTLNGLGASVTVDLLGEFIADIRMADSYRQAYLDLIAQFADSPVNGNFSLKPTMFGLLIDPDKCYAAVREIVSAAVARDGFVRIDMEDSRCVDLEIDLFGKLKQEFPGNVGLVVQAYLRRTPEDIASLHRAHAADAPLNFRLCKGIYVEPPEIAYQDMGAINRAFINNLDYMLRNGMYVGIATHDQTLIEQAERLISHYGLGPDQYEFQMLHGVTPRLRQRIIDAGHKMRVYIPFGKHWFGYATRRLKENPALVRHFLRGLVIKG